MTTAPRSLVGPHRALAVLAGVAATASLAAAVTGSTLARLTLGIALPVAVGVWISAIRQGRPPASVLAVLVLLSVAAPVHVALTSPTAAWAVDSHMVAPALLPSGSTRIAVAWTVPLLWLAAFAAVARAAHQRLVTRAGPLLLVGVGAAPLASGNAFPVDAYALLWDSSALGHPSYAVGACAFFLLTVLTSVRAAERPAGSTAPT